MCSTAYSLPFARFHLYPLLLSALIISLSNTAHARVDVSHPAEQCTRRSPNTISPALLQFQELASLWRSRGNDNDLNSTFSARSSLRDLSYLLTAKEQELNWRYITQAQGNRTPTSRSPSLLSTTTEEAETVFHSIVQRNGIQFIGCDVNFGWGNWLRFLPDCLYYATILRRIPFIVPTFFHRHFHVHPVLDFRLLPFMPAEWKETLSFQFNSSADKPEDRYASFARTFCGGDMAQVSAYQTRRNVVGLTASITARCLMVRSGYFWSETFTLPAPFLASVMPLLYGTITRPYYDAIVETIPTLVKIDLHSDNISETLSASGYPAATWRTPLAGKEDNGAEPVPQFDIGFQLRAFVDLKSRNARVLQPNSNFWMKAKKQVFLWQREVEKIKETQRRRKMDVFITSDALGDLVTKYKSTTIKQLISWQCNVYYNPSSTDFVHTRDGALYSSAMIDWYLLGHSKNMFTTGTTFAWSAAMRECAESGTPPQYKTA